MAESETNSKSLNTQPVELSSTAYVHASKMCVSVSLPPSRPAVYDDESNTHRTTKNVG